MGEVFVYNVLYHSLSSWTPSFTSATPKNMQQANSAFINSLLVFVYSYLIWIYILQSLNRKSIEIYRLSW